MRKINIMLLAALVASPLAMANYGGHGGPGGFDDDIDDVEIENTGNDYETYTANINLDKSWSKSIHINTDDDKLLMKNVGNHYDFLYENNSKKNLSFKKTQNHEVEVLLAGTKLEGGILDTSVTYGGACCKGGNGGQVEVMHTNMMYDGYQQASGINIAGQNVGNNSMVQQTTSTNAALVGSGGAGAPLGGGSY